MATITESFNTADSATLGPDQTWVEDQGNIDIVSNAAVIQTGGSPSVARVSSAVLDSLDQRVSALCNSSGTSVTPVGGVMARKAASSTLTYYSVEILWATDVMRMLRLVAGSASVLASQAYDSTPGTPVKVTIEVTGTTPTLIKGYANDVEVISFEDSAAPITSGLAVGIRGSRGSGGSQVSWDDFEAEDIVIDPGQVETPTIDPDGGSHEAEVEITLATTTPDATIYYTLDGSDPDETDIEYTAPFTITESATVKAIAFDDNVILNPSEIASAAFTITEPTGQVATPTFDPNGGGYVTEVEITIETVTPDATTYYTTDGSTPDETDTEYTVPFTITESATIKARAFDDNEILDPSAVASASFTITTEAAASEAQIVNMIYQKFKSPKGRLN